MLLGAQLQEDRFVVPWHTFLHVILPGALNRLDPMHLACFVLGRSVASALVVLAGGPVLIKLKLISHSLAVGLASGGPCCDFWIWW